MNNNFTGGQELVCINTTKVYDWVINDANFDLNVTDLDLPEDEGVQLTCDDIDTESVTCEVQPSDPAIEELNRETRTFTIGDEDVELQVVTLRKNFEVVFTLPLLAGGSAEVSAPFARSEQVILCAPDDTEIEVTFTELDCFIVDLECDPTTTPNSLDAVVNVRLCQSIQSTFDVTLELIADFCQPRDILSFPPCPTPAIPETCTSLFPNNNTPTNN
ncbi:hypothetical protein E3U55_12695 [Filobacillus milosensis]|uniref:DUF3794 domain-containing protein n=1 Tax=Filobacillus milosensis TaxID=94137 RepID=A0A4Y8IEX9_9BACI|nr:hypothetical protein [Filobacillus milosensis]TFB15104.1 hypothetical protein E3U55_12695 [Filobacillus milosensis]